MDKINFNSWQKGKQFYLLLWSIAMLIMAGMLLLGTRDKAAGKSIFKNNSIKSAEASNEMINELLLSGNELNIGEKNSFINLYLKPDENGPALTEENNENEREAIYTKILAQKINRLNAKSKPEDFSIKPIPK